MSEVPDDLTLLSLPQDFTELARTTTKPTDMPVRKPGKKQWFRVYPEPGWSGKFALFEDEESTDVRYLVAAHVYEGDATFAEACDSVLIFFCQYRSGSPFLWPCKLPRGGQGDTWHQSALDIAALAKTTWVKMDSDRTAGCYTKTTPDGDWEEPDWSMAYSFNDALKMAFRDRLILSSDHSKVRRFKGLE
jgi:hypothetical protein